MTEKIKDPSLSYIFEEVWKMKQVPRGHSHADPTNWVAENPQGGRVRTSCKVCGGFIGYRNVKSPA